ncbi:unnamed protein product (macronuclear) [Paramecium tetraurelia]|uniref:DUF1279 domain-containing protein n=1 Tax=Paramecium tetraurelia TaxID=5888 RepID=A0E910_PARTE|nr:uncharacterized protein GSPATT00024508001 [Paramecium tetraurelia]CAK91777.1 unnamed protein product [Paramecium tetraurelia]|eukprot:XP_001459174.1 hypothetical protein (macronuclear) [Paramecium tetraurelia strain d4-2]
MQQKAKQFFATYGKLGIGVYISYSIVNYGIVFFALKQGVDVKQVGQKYFLSFLIRLGFDTTQGKWEQFETYGTPTAAYIIYKLMAPIKWPIVIGTTAWICRKGKK